MEERPRVGKVDRAAGVELAPQLQEQCRNLGLTVEVGLDPAQHATVLPECALLAGAAIGVTLGNQLDRAERAVAFGRHARILEPPGDAAIRQDAERCCGKLPTSMDASGRGQLGTNLAQRRGLSLAVPRLCQPFHRCRGRTLS